MREFLEPMVLGTLVFPDEYLGKILKLCEVSTYKKHLRMNCCALNRKQSARLFVTLSLGAQRSAGGTVVHWAAPGAPEVHPATQ